MVAPSNDLHPALTAAVVRNAELAAAITAQCFSRLRDRMIQDGLVPEAGELRLPAALLMELGAIGQLSLWELEGLRDFLPIEVPTVAEAAAELNRRASTAPGEYQSLSGAKLAPRVLKIWLERICWAAPEMLAANIVIGEVDEDALVDAIARLVWENRAKSNQENC